MMILPTQSEKREHQLGEQRDMESTPYLYLYDSLAKAPQCDCTSFPTITYLHTYLTYQRLSNLHKGALQRHADFMP